MSEHHATIRWQRQSDEFTYDTYNREHEWHFDHGFVVPASAAPGYLGKEGFVDPEEAFVASLSSCHMLTFLAVAAKRKFVVEAYSDKAVGFLEKNEDGKLAITRVHLKPQIVFGDKQPDSEQLAKMHDSAHRGCFIASSVRTQIEVLAE